MDFIKQAVVGTAAAVAAPAGYSSSQKIRWRMPTSWPKAFDLIYGGAVDIADRGQSDERRRFRDPSYAGGELVGGLEVFDAVSQGTFPLGIPHPITMSAKALLSHSTRGFPSGFNFRQQNAWLYSGGGIEQMQTIRRLQYINIPAGNTGCQMGAGFRKEVNTPMTSRDSGCGFRGLAAR